MLVTALSLSALIAWAQHSYDDSLRQRTNNQLVFLERALRVPLWSLDDEAATQIGEAIAQDEILSSVEIRDHRGGIHFHRDKRRPVAFEVGATIHYADRPVGEVRLAINDEPRRRFLATIAAVAGVSGVVVVALQLLLIGPLLRRQLRAPFEALDATIRSYQAGHYDVERPRIPFSEFVPITGVLEQLGRTVEQQIKELRAAEEKYRRIFETTRVGIFRTTPEGEFIEVNPAWLELVGYDSFEDLLAHVTNASELYADPAEREAIVSELRREGRVLRREFRIRRKGGGLAWGSVTANAVHDASGRFTVIEGLVHDVTENKRMQELMIQTEKMTSVGGLAAGMAHELNNPLGIVLQSLENLARRFGPELPANQPAAREAGIDLAAVRRYMSARGISEYLVATRQAAERAAEIIRTMLEFSRTGESSPGPCALAGIVDVALELAAKDYDLRRKFDFRAVRVVRELDVRTPAVACTAGEMVQVVLNIVKNAAEALADGHEPAQEPTIWLRTRLDGDYARLEIRDNGPGMNEATRRRVFEPYFSTKGPGEGTGLGLSVAYFIVTQRNAGTITVESSPGQGTTFVIRLPVATVVGV